MSEPNPWKQQMLQNKAKLTNQQSPNQVGSGPSWMKKQSPKTQSNLTDNPSQPSWMNKKPTQTVITTPSNSQTNQNQTNSQPSWMKKQPSTTQTNNQPAWMQKNNSSVQNQSPTSTWKAGGTQFLSPADKKKKEQQQRLKKQQQEHQQRLKQQERLRIIEEQRLAQIKKQQQQKYAKQQQERLRIQEQDRIKKQQQQKTKSKYKTSKPTHRRRQTKSRQSNVIFHKYLNLFQLSVMPQLSECYKQRLNAQKQLILLSKQFSLGIQKKLMHLINNPTSQSKTLSNRKNKLLSLPQIPCQIYYGLCQGKQLHNKIHFDVGSIQKLEKVMLFYDDLNDVITKFLRKISSFKLRLTIWTTIKYKGMLFLAECISDELTDTLASSPAEFKQVFNDYVMVEKQLTDKYNYQIGKNDLAIKKIYIQQFDQQFYILVLKNWDIIKKKSISTSCSLQVELQKISSDYYYLSCLEPLTLKTEPSEFQSLKKLKSQSFSTFLDILHLAQAINIVWSSCQGEVEESSFLNLVLSQSQDVWGLIKVAGYEGKFINSGLVFQLFQVMAGVKVNFNKLTWAKQNVVAQPSYCKLTNFSFKNLQVNEIIKNFDKYLRQNKFQLAQNALQMSRQLEFPQTKQSQCTQTREYKLKQTSIGYMLQKGRLLEKTKKISSAIKLYKSELEVVIKKSRTSFMLIPVQIQLLSLYIQTHNQNLILQTFSSLLQLTQLYYGQQTLINCTLYQMMGSYYSTKKDKQNYVIQFYQHALRIALTYYGQRGVQIAHIYQARAIAFFNLGRFQLFQKDVEIAIKIYKTHSKCHHKIAQCYFFKGKAKLLSQPPNIAQGIQLIQQCCLIYIKISHYIQGINSLLYLFDHIPSQNQSKREQISQKIFNLCTYFKNIHYVTKAITFIIAKVDLELKDRFVSIKQKQQKQYLSKINHQYSQQNNLHSQQNNQNKQSNISNKQSNKQSNISNLQIQTTHQDLQRLEIIIKGFSTFLEAIRWLGFSIIVDRSSNNKVLNQKNQQFIQIITKFFDHKLLQLPIQEEYKSDDQLQVKINQLPLLNSQSPIKRINLQESQRVLSQNQSID